jgi:hypothetical protein
MTTARVMRLLAGSPTEQIHRLLTGQTLDGWPQVQAFDANGVVVRAVPVTFSTGGAASFGGGDSVQIVTDNRGHAIALGLRGVSAGQANVTVSCQDAAPLTYTVDVVQVGGPGF